jgi:CBS domain containing-hemolysin-like protein
MLDLILLSIFSYALYRMAVGYNITPWKWIIRYVVTFMASSFALVAVLFSIYGENMMKDIAFVGKLGMQMEPFILLYQFVLFFFFRVRILKYVHALDQVDKVDNTPPPSSPQPPKKEDKDLYYFR